MARWAIYTGGKTWGASNGSTSVCQHTHNTRQAWDRATSTTSTSMTWPQNPANTYTAKSEPYKFLINFTTKIQVR
ncbi:hypothetical protein AtNW77_Chr3g0195191 [Arabidopsis thaliana]